MQQSLAEQTVLLRETVDAAKAYLEDRLKQEVRWR